MVALALFVVTCGIPVAIGSLVGGNTEVWAMIQFLWVVFIYGTIASFIPEDFE